MKNRIILTGMLLSAAITFQSAAGTLFYVPIPAVGSDAESGLDAARGYTNAVAAGTAKERNVNGVPFAPLSGAGNVITADGVTLSAATGTLANGGGKADSIRADGSVARLFSGMIFNDGAADNSEQYVVLDPASLAAGRTYDLRVYIANATGENRQVNLSFAGDGKPAVITDFFNEDDATTSAGGFLDPNQVYYINYRFTWDGVSTPGFTATQRFGNTPFVLFALTNQEVGGDVDARPAGALVAAPLAPIAARPTTTSRRTRVVVEDEDIGVSSDVFYRSETLRSRGRWVTVGRYGRCWQPLHVDDDWQPYTRGRWVHSSDEGWVWDSDEDFGWATYHYGRWFREEDSGWYWVPGRVWAPAWVSWRHGHSYVGWAPLPPVAIAVVGIGIGSWADERWSIGPQAYNFVNTRDFGARSISNVIISRQQNVNIMTNTTNVTNIVNSNNTTIYNGGPNYQALSNTLARNGGQPIPTVQVARKGNTAPVTPDGKFSQLSGGVLALTAPEVPRNKKPTALPPVAATIAAPKLDKGWKGVTDPTRAAALQAKIASETPGAKSKTAPARLPGTIPTPAPATGKAAANGLKPFRNGKPGGNALVQPGQPATPGSANPLRPGAPVNPTATIPTLPGQPATAPGGKGKRGEKPATPTLPVVKPGEPVNPTAVTPTLPGQPAIAPGGKGKRGEKTATPNLPVVKPGEPVNPTAVTPTLPGQPAITPGDKGKRGEKPATPNLPVVKPGEPVNPAAVTPTLPGQPAITPGGKGKRGEKTAVPNVPVVKPGEPVKTPELPLVKPGQVVKPGNVSPPVTVPPATQPIVPTTPKPEKGSSKNRTRQPEPTAPPTIVKPTVPTPATEPVIKPTVPTVTPKESPRIKKGTPSTAPTNPTPIQAPVIKPAPVPEPIRIKRKPEPTAPIQVPRAAPTPAPAPVRVPEPERIKKHTPPPAAPVPAPVRRIERPAPQPVAPPRPAPVVIQPRPAPQPVAPPRPAPVVVQPRPAPPISVPVRPVAPAPAPGKGPQPTPTPEPGKKR